MIAKTTVPDGICKLLPLRPLHWDDVWVRKGASEGELTMNPYAQKRTTFTYSGETAIETVWFNSLRVNQKYLHLIKFQSEPVVNVYRKNSANVIFWANLLPSKQNKLPEF